LSTTSPSICVVIPAHRRPQELRRAVAAARAQDYPGVVQVVVVYDRSEPDHSLEDAGDRPVTVTTNSRTPGLAGARNTGIFSATTDLIAFCDDDDVWKPTKLRRQVEELEKEPAAVVCSTAILATTPNRATPRLAGTSRVSHRTLVGSRMSMVHSSTLLFRKEPLRALGGIDETIPKSMGEDWDILLRASAVHPVVHVDEPLVEVSFGESFFRRDWKTKAEAKVWFLRHHPELSDDRRACARVVGQAAFAYACDGQRRKAWRWAENAIRRDVTQWRAYLAACVALFPPSGDAVMTVLNRFGRGV